MSKRESDKPRDTRTAAINVKPESKSRDQEREAWLAENREAIEAYNERIRRDGIISMGRRRF